MNTEEARAKAGEARRHPLAPIVAALCDEVERLREIDTAFGEVHRICAEAGTEPGHIVGRVSALAAMRRLERVPLRVGSIPAATTVRSYLSAIVRVATSPSGRSWRLVAQDAQTALNAIVFNDLEVERLRAENAAMREAIGRWPTLEPIDHLDAEQNNTDRANARRAAGLEP